MDKYLTIFSEQLDAAFKPEIAFPDQEFYVMGWLKRKFSIKKGRKKSLKENFLQMHHTLKPKITT